MSLVLALDTSTPIGAVGIGEGARVLAEGLLEVRAAHSEAILPELRRLLRVTNRTVDELGAVVVGSGPGSFTGVRIAAAFAKGICYGREIPLFAYSSLAAIAASVERTGPICATIDARRGQVYAAGFEFGRGLVTRFGPVAIPAASIPERLSPDEPWVLAGGGLDAMPRDASCSWEIVDSSRAAPTASALLRLAARYPDAGRVADVPRWEPGYVRESSASRSEPRR